MNKQIKTLLDNQMLDTPEKVNLFDTALIELAKKNHPESLEELFTVFSDKAVNQEVMWGLVHHIETYDEIQEINAIVNTLPYLQSNANEWLKIIVIRILNNPEMLKKLTNRFSSLNHEQAIGIKKLLAEISDESKGFKERTASILKSLDNV
jgi:hypothetical protein